MRLFAFKASNRKLPEKLTDEIVKQYMHLKLLFKSHRKIRETG